MLIRSLMAIIILQLVFIVACNDSPDMENVELGNTPPAEGIIVDIPAAPKAKLKRGKIHSHDNLEHHVHTYTAWRKHKKDPHTGIYEKTDVYMFQGGSGDNITIGHEHPLAKWYDPNNPQSWTGKYRPTVRVYHDDYPDVEQVPEFYATYHVHTDVLENFLTSNHNNTDHKNNPYPAHTQEGFHRLWYKQHPHANDPKWDLFTRHGTQALYYAMNYVPENNPPGRKTANSNDGYTRQEIQRTVQGHLDWLKDESKYSHGGKFQGLERPRNAGVIAPAWTD